MNIKKIIFGSFVILNLSVILFAGNIQVVYGKAFNQHEALQNAYANIICVFYKVIDQNCKVEEVYFYENKIFVCSVFYQCQ